MGQRSKARVIPGHKFRLHNLMLVALPRSFSLLLLLACLGVTSVSCADELEPARAAIRIHDYDTAVPLLESLANGGNARAQYQLAALYRAGTGVPKNHEKASYWLQKAAKQGHRNAQYNLGVMYENGWGVTPSETKAHHWYQQAAAQGHPMALKKLGKPDASLARMKNMEEPVHTTNPGETLRWAAATGDEISVRAALDSGAGIDAVDKYGRTALLEAAGQGNAGIVQLLL